MDLSSDGAASTSILTDPARLAVLRETGLGDVVDDEILERMTGLAVRVLGASVSLVSVVTAEGQHFPAQTGLSAPWAEAAGTPLSHSFCRLVVESGSPVVITDARQDPRVRDSPGTEALSIGAYAGSPLVIDDHVLGAVCVIDHERREWSESELTTLADISAAAASEIRARRQVRAAAERLAMLSELTIALHAELDADAALRELAARIVPVLAELCVVDIVGVARRDLRTVAITSDDTATEAAFRASEALAPRSENPRYGVRRILDGGPSEWRVFDDAAIAAVTDDPRQRQLYAALGVTHLAMVPVAGRRGAYGVLSLGRSEASGDFTLEDRALIEEMGRRVGMAVENAKLFERERRTALALQERLLPALPRIPGLEIAGRYLPSPDAGQVGGDWYEVMALPDGSVGIVAGDVAGHDLVAAARMGQLRAVVQAFAWQEPSPGRVLDRACELVRALDEEQTPQCSTADWPRFAPTAAGSCAGPTPVTLPRSSSCRTGAPCRSTTQPTT